MLAHQLQTKQKIKKGYTNEKISKSPDKFIIQAQQVNLSNSNQNSPKNIQLTLKQSKVNPNSNYNSHSRSGQSINADISNSIN